MILHRLDGCAPTPLAHYLKALGILRLVSEQEDSEARGWWEQERFMLATYLDEDELSDLFLKEYSPTPLLAPWNGASGFFRTWDTKNKKLRESKNGRALHTLISQDAKRWKPFQRVYEIAISTVSNVLKEVDVDQLSPKERGKLLIVPKGSGPVFPVADKEDDKTDIQRAMSQACADNGLFSSAIVDMGDEFGYPSLWGSGGNDGAIDFTARYFENLIQALVEGSYGRSAFWLSSSLYGTPANSLLTKAAGKVGQFLPGGAGGANSINGPGSQHNTLLNPWDFIFMLEGAVLFTAHATRRFGSTAPSRAAAPFAIGGQGAGYASAAESDESARGEQWMPLWSQPTTLPELHRLLAEGRAQIGARPVTEPIDMARAVANFGTARGIAAFQRYGYIERNGQSNLAVPLGRFRVPDHISPQIACLDDLHGWLLRLRRAARDRGAPTRLKLVEHRLSDALFAVAQHPDESARWQTVVLALADTEAVLLNGPNVRCGPIPPLRPEWVSAADDGSAEWRLAVAFALQARGLRRNDKSPIDRIRRHWIPGKNQETAAVMRGRRGVDDAIALVERRLIEAAQSGMRSLPLVAAYQAHASLTDLTALLGGNIDTDRTITLARTLMAVKGWEWAQRPQPIRRPAVTRWPDEGWMAVRLTMLPQPLPDGRSIGIDPTILRRLESGDAATAITLALRRLRAAGTSATVRFGSVSPEAARLWAAAIAFPIQHRTAERMLRRLEAQSVLE